VPLVNWFLIIALELVWVELAICLAYLILSYPIKFNLFLKFVFFLFFNLSISLLKVDTPLVFLPSLLIKNRQSLAIGEHFFRLFIDFRLESFFFLILSVKVKQSWWRRSWYLSHAPCVSNLAHVWCFQVHLSLLSVYALDHRNIWLCLSLYFFSWCIRPIFLRFSILIFSFCLGNFDTYSAFDFITLSLWLYVRFSRLNLLFSNRRDLRWQGFLNLSVSRNYSRSTLHAYGTTFHVALLNILWQYSLHVL